MAREYIKLCWTCADIMGEHYHLTEEQDPEHKRSRCQQCRFSGYLSRFSYDPSMPKRLVEGRP